MARRAIVVLALASCACRGRAHEEAKPDPTPASSASASAKSKDVGPERAEVSTRKIEIPRVGHDPVVLNLPVVDVGDRAKNDAIAAWISPEKILGESLDDVRDEAAEVKSASDPAIGVDGCSFDVTYDAHGLLQIDADTEFMGAYPSGSTFHVVVDLHAPRLLRARDVFRKESISSLVERLDALVVAEAKSSDAAKNPDTADLVKDAHFLEEELDGFSIDDDGVTFRHDYAFPHVVLGAEPDGRYLLAWKDLAQDILPDGPLARVAWAK